MALLFGNSEVLILFSKGDDLNTKAREDEEPPKWACMRLSAKSWDGLVFQVVLIQKWSEVLYVEEPGSF